MSDSAVEMESEIRCFILNQSEFSAFSTIISDNKTPTMKKNEKEKHDHKGEDTNNNNNNLKSMNLGHRVTVQAR